MSVAYYEKPAERKMSDKVWRGADLFFDLDLNAGSNGNLNDVLFEAISIRDVLDTDFGLDSDLIFSGSKGYHIVSNTDDQRVLRLGSKERSEIVLYLKVKYRCKYIDGAVTRDIHRLRRIPGTINSKSEKMCDIVKSGYIIKE